MNGARIEQTRCNLCGERLTDPESIKRGIGPVCAGKLTDFMAVVESSVEEIASLAVVDDGAVSKWLRVAKKAFAAKQHDQAKRFFAAARCAARYAKETLEEQAA